MADYGRKPRPRVLLQNQDSALSERVSAIAPTVVRVRNLYEINQAEFDLLVTDSCPSPLGRMSNPALAVGRDLSVIYRPSESRTIGECFAHLPGDRSEEFSIPDETPRSLRQLVERKLLPSAQATRKAGESNDYYKAIAYPGSRTQTELVPLLSTQQGNPIAACYHRGPKSVGFLLPPDVEDLAPWVAAVIEFMHDFDPDGYPERDLWVEAWTWQTPTEQELEVSRSTLAAERVRVISELDRQEEELVERLNRAKAAADGGERRLLTAQGSDLVEAVISALRDDLGFQVVDVDKVIPDSAQKMEDLQVTDPDHDPDWVALVEVRGYKTGAKSSDLGRIERFVTHYVKQQPHGPDPDKWYVVNQLLERSPAVRSPVLESAVEDVKGFAQSGGSVCDTRDLFRLAMAVRRNQVTSSGVRQFLRANRGICEPPALWVEEPAPDGPATGG